MAVEWEDKTMSTFNTEEFRALAQDEIMPGIRDQIAKASLLTKRMYGDKSAKDKHRMASQLIKTVSYGEKEPTQTNGRDTTVVPTEYSAEKQMALRYKWTVGDILLYDDDVQNNKGDKIVDLLTQRLKDSGKGMKKKVGQLIFSGNSETNPLEPDGLGVIIHAGNSYAGIDRTVFTWWAGKVKDSPASRTFTLSEIDEMWNNLSTGLDESPTIQVTTPELWLAGRDALQARDRALSSHKGLAEYGIENYILNGSMVIKDIYCPAGWWIHLNENVTKLFVDPDYDIKLEEFQRVPNRPHIQTAYIKLAWLIWCEQPNLNGIHKGLAVAP